VLLPAGNDFPLISDIVHYQETTAGMCRENRRFILQMTKVLRQVNLPENSFKFLPKAQKNGHIE